MIAFYIVGLSMKTLRDALFGVMMRTTTETEEKAGLKWCFGTFLQFLVCSIGLQIRV
jgi:hypothetical protein